MSNSPLVSYTKLSPNCNKPRNHVIDTITIHHMAGNTTIEACGNLFASKERKASSNYGIGSDGRIGLYVDEANRCWCSSSAPNDHRAVVIEVANSGGAPDWPISDKAYNALITLCADICRRNGIKRLLWENDKSLIGNIARQNITVHQWFAATACPGPYIMRRMGDIANDVNKQLGVSVSPPIVAKPALSSEPVGNVEKFVWDYLRKCGLNDCAVAGLMGNLFAESALNPKNLQNTFEKKLGYTDDTYTSAVDDGAYTNFVRDSAGYGLAQWTYWSRKEKLLNYVKTRGKSIGDVEAQLGYLWEELQGYTGLMSKLKNVQNVRVASDAVLLDFERPADQSESVKKRRAEYSQKFYNKYAGSAAETAKPEIPNTGFTPYKVQVATESSNLNVRKGPGSSFPLAGSMGKDIVTTVLEEAHGPGAKLWGRIGDTQWIALDFTERV